MMDVPTMQPNGAALKPCQRDLETLNRAQYFGPLLPADHFRIRALTCTGCEPGRHIRAPAARLFVWHEGGFALRKLRVVYRANRATWSTSAYAGVHSVNQLDAATRAYLARLGDEGGAPIRVTGDLFQSLRALRAGEDCADALRDTASACRLNGAWAFAWEGEIYDCSGTREAYGFGIDLDGHLRQIEHLDAGVILDETFYSVCMWRTILAQLVLLLSVGAILWQIIREDKAGLSGVLESIGNVILLLGLLKYVVSDSVRDVNDAKRLLFGYARVEQGVLLYEDRVCLANYEGLVASTDGSNMSYSDASFIVDWAARSPPVKTSDLAGAGWLVFDTFALSPKGLLFRVDVVGSVLRITRETVKRPSGILYPNALVGG